MSKQGENEKNIHVKHRDRVKKRFRDSGLDDFSEVQVLELLLFYCRAREDTNPIAHRLLDHFGSFAGVMEAPVEELIKVEGMGSQSALFLNLIHQTERYYRVNLEQQNKILLTTEQCGKYLIPFFHGLRNETAFLLCLDAKCKVLCCKKLGEGTVNSTAIPIRRVVEIALGFNATSVVLAHNHPSGIAIPSGEDVQTTMRVAAALSTVDVVLADHIVVADNDYVSMKDSGMLSSIYGM